MFFETGFLNNMFDLVTILILICLLYDDVRTQGKLASLEYRLSGKIEGSEYLDDGCDDEEKK